MMGFREIDLPDGSVGEFPDTMGDDEIAAVLKKQFSPEATGSKMMQDITRSPASGFAGTTSARDLLRKIEPDAKPGEPSFYGNPQDPQSIMEAGRFRGTADAAGPSVGILANAAGGGLLGGTRLGLGALGAGEEALRNPSPKNIIRGGLMGAFAPDILKHTLGPAFRYALGGRGGLARAIASKGMGSTTAAEAATATEEAVAAKRAAWELKQRISAESKGVADQLKVEEQWLRATEGARKADATKRSLAEASAAREGISTENAWLKAQEAARKKGVPANIPAEEASHRAAAEAQAIKDQIKVENQWLAAQGKEGAALPGVSEEEQFIKTLMDGGTNLGKMTRQKAEELAGRLSGAVTKSAPLKSAVLPDGQRAMATNLGGTAKAAPARSADQLEAALRNSVKANEVKTGLAAERLRVGAERAGGRKGPLMTALARDEAGPVLGEMRGTASPVLPEKAIADIAAALRKLPRGGPERLAYVERATSGKAKATGETIRRALESMGLLVPLGVAGMGRD